jgi:hypothetical protein
MCYLRPILVLAIQTSETGIRLIIIAPYTRKNAQVVTNLV